MKTMLILAVALTAAAPAIAQTPAEARLDRIEGRVDERLSQRTERIDARLGANPDSPVAERLTQRSERIGTRLETDRCSQAANGSACARRTIDRRNDRVVRRIVRRN